MLSAFYGKGFDSSPVFEDKKIAQSEDYREYMNKYDIIEVDMNVFRHRTDTQTRLPITATQTVALFQQEVIQEIHESYPDCLAPDEADLPNALTKVHAKTSAKFIIIIDEWDTIFREDPDDEEAQGLYLKLLRGLFKDATSKEFLALGYLTGILPVKKYGTQSALNNFDEFTMINPEPLDEYVGFTEAEVQGLCQKYHMDFPDIKQWYDGYQLNDHFHIYNPKSVVDAMRRRRIDNYWTRTETYESLKKYISMNFDGLKNDVIEMLGGGHCRVNPDKFQNDMVTFKSRDDVFALLIHLGYLAFDHDRREVYIPNAEVRSEFVNAIEGNEWSTVVDAITASGAMKDYVLIRELPTGEGFADIAFLPRQKTDSPALLIELKYDHTAESAIDQIKAKKYAGKLLDHGGTALLVRISYDKKTKKHLCKIEEAIIQ